MKHDGIQKFVARSESEFRAHIDAAIDAARVPWERGKQHSGDVEPDDENELAEPSVPAPSRQRKRSLTKVCEAARKAGADRIIVDGVVIVLSPSAAVPESDDANEWDTVLLESDHGPH